jgi:predicted transcriptional regulator
MKEENKNDMTVLYNAISENSDKIEKDIERFEQTKVIMSGFLQEQSEIETKRFVVNKKLLVNSYDYLKVLKENITKLGSELQSNIKRNSDLYKENSDRMIAACDVLKAKNDET